MLTIYRSYLNISENRLIYSILSNMIPIFEHMIDYLGIFFNSRDKGSHLYFLEIHQLQFLAHDQPVLCKNVCPTCHFLDSNRFRVWSLLYS